MAEEVGNGDMKFIIVIVFAFAIGALLLIVLTKMRSKRAAIARTSSSPNVVEHPSSPRQSSVEAISKRCPTCRTTYTDETLSYCLIDGASLIDAANTATPYDPQATVKLNRKGDPGLAPTIQYHPNLPNDQNKT